MAGAERNIRAPHDRAVIEDPPVAADDCDTDDKCTTDPEQQGRDVRGSAPPSMPMKARQYAEVQEPAAAVHDS